MIIKSTELIYKDHPLTTEGVKRFADAIVIGDMVPTMRKVRVWTSNSNFTFHEKYGMVEITKKYPHLVEFSVKDYNIFGEKVTLTETLTWNEFVIGYCKCSGVIKLDDKGTSDYENKAIA